MPNAIVTETSQDAYFEHERQVQRDRKAVLQVKNMATIRAETAEFDQSPIYEWLGDLPISLAL